MSFTKTLRGVACGVATTVLMTSAAFAGGGMTFTDPYVRASSPNAKAGAAFLTIENTSGQDDVLVSVSSDVAARVELHTHIDDGNGVMQMRHVEDGFSIEAGASHVLERGGDHVMFMGLSRSLNDGDTVEVTFTFQNAGDMVVEIPVDLKR